MVDLARGGKAEGMLLPHPGAKLGRLATEWAFHPPQPAQSDEMLCSASHHSATAPLPHLTLLITKLTSGPS